MDITDGYKQSYEDDVLLCFLVTIGKSLTVILLIGKLLTVIWHIGKK